MYKTIAKVGFIMRKNRKIVKEGYVEGVDVPISTYFPEILNSGSEYKNQLTIWNLLTHTTGLDASDTANWNEWLNSSNWVDYVLNRQAVSRHQVLYLIISQVIHIYYQQLFNK